MDEEFYKKKAEKYKIKYFALLNASKRIMKGGNKGNLFVVNIEEETKKNEDYRKILFTSDHQQLVVMSLQPNEDIPLEIHDGHDQFIRIEEGIAEIHEGIKQNDKDNQISYRLTDGYSVTIPAGTWHYVKNAGDKDLKLYTIYSPKEHDPNRHDLRQP